MINLIKIIFIAFLFIISSCNSDSSKKELKNKIGKLEDSLSQSFTSASDQNLKIYKKAIKAWEKYSKKYPDDSLAPKYLFKAAQGHENLNGNYKKALGYYKKIHKKYPDYKDHSMMLFHLANAYDEINDSAKAINTYKKFIKKYPDHDFVDDAKGMIRFIKMDKKSKQEFFNKAASKDSAKSDSLPQ